VVTGFELHPRELKIGSQTLRFKNGGAIPLRETVGIDALIGRDVLSSAYLVYNGIKGTVSVSFAEPAPTEVTESEIMRDEKGRAKGMRTTKRVVGGK
jgi:hypothetical protein